MEGLVLVTPPSTPAVSLEAAKRWLSLNVDDEDDDVADLVSAAEEAAWNYGLSTCQATWRYALDCFPCVIHPPLYPLVSVTSVTYPDTAGTTQTVSASVYSVYTDGHPGRIAPAYGKTWPASRTQPEAVKVTFVAGYAAAADIPQRVRQAIRIMVRHWYDNPDGEREVPDAARNLLLQCWSGYLR